MAAPLASRATMQTARKAPSQRAAEKFGVCVVALLGFVVQATTFVARLASIRILPATQSAEDLIRGSLGAGAAAGAPRLTMSLRQLAPLPAPRCASPSPGAAATRSAKLGVRERQQERPISQCSMRQLAPLPAPRCASPSPGRPSLWLLPLAKQKKVTSCRSANGINPHPLKYPNHAKTASITNTVIKLRITA